MHTMNQADEAKRIMTFASITNLIIYLNNSTTNLHVFFFFYKCTFFICDVWKKVEDFVNSSLIINNPFILAEKKHKIFHV